MAFVYYELQYTKSMIPNNKFIINYFIRNKTLLITINTNYNDTLVIQ